MDHVANLAKRASQITVYIYNHVYLLSWLRNRKGWGEIVRPGPTRFATTFIALGSLNEHMHDLQALVTSKFFVESRYAKDKKAKEVVKIILDPKFWNDCRVIVHIVSPLIRLLRIVDSDEHPAMGYVYDGIYRAIDGIKKLFKDKKKFWEPYINIIKDRWDNQFSQEIHAAAYWLNPTFQYDPSTSSKRQEVHGALTDVIEMRVSSSRHKLVDELKLFRERVGTFGKLLALETSKTTQPDEWWKLWGGCAPTLQKFAIRILSQTASVNVKKFNFDPIDYESIDKTEFWIVEDEEPPCLDYEELEATLYEEGAYPVNEGSSSHVQGDDEVGGTNLGPSSEEQDAPPGFNVRNNPIEVDDDDDEEEEEEEEDEDDDEDSGGGGGFGVDDDIDFNYEL
ncbi:hAT dimerization domain-containing protein [Fagus crenata]